MIPRALFFLICIAPLAATPATAYCVPTPAGDSVGTTVNVDSLVASAHRSEAPVITDTSVLLFYRGKAARVSVASDLNQWNPAASPMRRVAGTDLWFCVIPAPPAARFDYKLIVDSTWILDPSNPLTAVEGFGPNSEIRMPLYRAPSEPEYRENIRHGSLDTIVFRSEALARPVPVIVYVPPGLVSGHPAPTVFVADGGEYLSLAQMNNVLDNLIAGERIPPVIGVFVDPRTDLRDSRTSRRMTEYSMSDSFVTFLVRELRPFLSTRYPLAVTPDRTAILGASLGGLIATYVAFQRPDVFGLCAAQSPAYQIHNGDMLTLMADSPRKPFRMYLGTGTIYDAETYARRMRSVLAGKGYEFRYDEVPESHSWANWRARLADVLTYFWGNP